MSEPKVNRCIWCGKILTEKNTYISKSKTNFDGRTVWCKDCIGSQYVEYWDKYKDIRKSVWNNCRKFDFPYVEASFSSMLNHVNDEKEYNSEKIFGVYIQKLFSLKCEQGVDCFDDGTTDLSGLYLSGEDIAKSLEDKWGIGYQSNEYDAFEKKYNMLKNNYPEKTALHTEALMNYVRYRCKEELATANGNIKEAKEWSALASKAATDAKINPSQLSAADLQGGLNSFSEIALAAEQEYDIIKVMPEFKYRPNDAPDFIIWCYMNYIRKAKGLPKVEYKEIYEFYDEKKREYIEQYGDPYGMFDGDPTETNRKKIENFIKMPNGSDSDE